MNNKRIVSALKITEYELNFSILNNAPQTLNSVLDTAFTNCHLNPAERMDVYRKLTDAIGALPAGLLIKSCCHYTAKEYLQMQEIFETLVRQYKLNMATFDPTQYVFD